MFLPEAMKFLFKNFLPHSINNGFQQQKTLNKNTISTRQKRILKLLFVLVETIIEIRKNQNFLKTFFFQLMKTDLELSFY